jgi:hypothetical protein
LLGTSESILKDSRSSREEAAERKRERERESEREKGNPRGFSVETALISVSLNGIRNKKEESEGTGTKTRLENTSRTRD